MRPEELRLRDEILQVLFWVRGEGMGEDADPRELATWLGTVPTALTGLLGEMHRDGFLEPGRRPGSWTLSELGLAEGGRRFTEEFADAGLGAGGHGECGPGCDCEKHGPEACREHGAQARGSAP